MTERSSSEERLRELLEAHGAFLHRTVLKLCSGRLRSHAADVEQEVRVRLWRAVESAREISDPASYIYRTAATAAIDAVRRLEARPDADGGSEAEARLADVAGAEVSPERAALRRELFETVMEALMRIPESRRRPVRLHLLGFTSLEVARLMGASEPKARSLIYRGLSDLRVALRAMGVDLEG